MALPLATTTVRVERFPVDLTRDSYDPPPAALVVASGVRAVFSGPRGAETRQGGSQTDVTWGLSCDPCDVSYLDRVVDEATGETFEVETAVARSGLNLDHMACVVRRVEGQV